MCRHLGVGSITVIAGLLRRTAAAIIDPMRLSRSSRSAVAICAAVLLLLCQVAFAAQACAHDFASAAPAMAAPCHEAMGDAGGASDSPGAASICEAAKAVADTSKLPIADITDFPALTVAQVGILTPRWSTSSPRPTTTAVCHSPPLTLLHCRFLN
jgi:hypothetical protein